MNGDSITLRTYRASAHGLIALAQKGSDSDVSANFVNFRALAAMALSSPANGKVKDTSALFNFLNLENGHTDATKPESDWSATNR